MPRESAGGSGFTIHPAFAGRLAALGLDSPERLLDLRGEIVSGHPDRHVLRVELPGFRSALYLKRQHLITRRERFRNWRAGFGWVSCSERERALLEELAKAGLPAPRWIAAGEDGRGRAFVLVEEVADAVDLRSALASFEPSVERAQLAGRIGKLIDDLHRQGFTTPDLSAKHVLVSGEKITLIDWQNARRVARVRLTDRSRALAALHASIPRELASERERLRVLRAALRTARVERQEKLSIVARRIAAEAKRLGTRRSFRDQRLAPSSHQRLVWVAGEAVCAVPDVAEMWPAPAIAPPFYDAPPGRRAIRLPDGRPAHLIRGSTFDPFGRLSSRLRGKSWRSPGATLGRVLFHLERYGIPAPRLLAFGQRLTGRASAEWFALHTPLPALIREVDPRIAEQLGRRLRQLHDACCRPVRPFRAAFGMAGRVSIRDVTAILLVKRLTRHQRLHDLGELARTFAPELHESVRMAYVEGRDAFESDEVIPANVCR